MVLNYLTNDQKKQYVTDVIVRALMNRFGLHCLEAENCITASPLQRMLDDGYIDYVMGSDEEYWIEQIVQSNIKLQSASKPNK